MSSKTQRLVVVCGALVGLSLVVYALRVLTAADADRVAMLPDDAFYYLTLAKNVVRDGAWTFDGGVSLTTGFHPLFAYLLVPLAALSDGRTLIDLASALVSVTALVTFGVAFWRAYRARRWDVALAITMIAGSAMVMLLTTIIIEWPFTIACCGLFWAELARVDGLVGDPRLRRRALVWLALAVLARSDSVLLVGPLVLVDVVAARRVRGRVFWPIGAALGGYALVTLHGVLIAGALTQSSAATKLDWALSQGVSPGPALTMVAQVLSPVELRFNLGLSLVARLALLGSGAALVAAFVWATRKAARTLPRPLVGAALATVVAYVAAYSFNSAAMDSWYTAPFIAPLVILLAYVLGRLAVLPFPVLVVVALGYLGVHAVMAQRLDDHRAAQRAVLALADATRATVNERRTASINAGLFGFEQGGHVVNIDGLVNDDIAAYRKADRLACYLVDHGVEYLEDVDLMPRDQAYWARHGDPQLLIRAALTPVTTRVVDAHEATLYALDREALGAACGP